MFDGIMGIVVLVVGIVVSGTLSGNISICKQICESWSDEALIVFSRKEKAVQRSGCGL